MNTILITGGQGDIATSLIKHLKATGSYQIFAPSHAEMDVTNIEAVSDYVQKIKSVDILVNNAGINIDTQILSSDIHTEKKILDTNLFGAFNCANAVLKNNKNAIIINIGSMSGTAPGATYNSYRAAKAGLIMATRCWAMEGVRTCCINVGRLAGKMRQKLFPNGDPFADTLLKQDQLAAFIVKLITHFPSVENGQCFCVHSDNVEQLMEKF